MSILKETTGQAREAFASMPLQSRIISVMLVVAIAIGLAFLIRDTRGSSKEYLFGGHSFREQELDAIEVAFSRAGLNDWEREGRRIRLPSESKAEYLAALQESSTLPTSLRSSKQYAIAQMGVFDSDQMRQARLMHAKEQDLGSTIAKFHDVNWAKVEYDRGDRRGLGRTRPQSASVVVQPEGTGALSRERILAIKEMIRASYAGMSIDDVVVIDTNSSSTSALAENDDPLLRRQREVEARVEQKVRSVLIGYPARVAVSAQIDPTMDVEKATLTYDAEPTTLSTKTRKIESSTNRQPVRGVPGTIPNAIGNRAASLDENLDSTRNKEDQRESSGVAGQQYEASRLASLQVKKIRVSVGLPTSYYKKLHTQDFLEKQPDSTVAEVPPLNDTELEKLRTKTTKNIRAAITVLLPEVSAGANPDPLVEVWDYPDLPVAPEPETKSAQAALTWLADSWQTIALILLALVALLVARSVATHSGEPAPKDFQEGFGLEIPAPPAEPEGSEDDEDKMTITGGSLKEELLTLVEGNPEVAANVIRGWVGEAA